MNEEEKVLEKTILNTGIAKPISVSREEAEALAKESNANNNIPQAQVAEAIPVTKEELDEQKVNEINDLMKNDYVKLVDVHHSKKTYIILFVVLALIIALIVLEAIYFGGKI